MKTKTLLLLLFLTTSCITTSTVQQGRHYVTTNDTKHDVRTYILGFTVVYALKFDYSKKEKK